MDKITQTGTENDFVKSGQLAPKKIKAKESIVEKPSPEKIFDQLWESYNHDSNSFDMPCENNSHQYDSSVFSRVLTFLGF